MKRDFTLQAYHELIRTAKRRGYAFLPLEQVAGSSELPARVLILRHDVDRRPGYALRLASLQHDLGISGTYYFRIVKESFDPTVVAQVAALGHEIGYHYEDLALAKGDLGRAYRSFVTNLEMLRAFYPVRTVCMHGSPTSPWDNRMLWRRYDYRELGIVLEPYLDLDFDDVFYLTDTGRTWNGRAVSVRDQVSTRFAQIYSTTAEIVAALRDDSFPRRVLLNVHPQRWTNGGIAWTRELVAQSSKNVIKRIVIRTLNRHQAG